MSDFFAPIAEGWTSLFGAAGIFVIWGIAKVSIVLGIILGIVPFIVLMERKVIAWIQVRPGPNRVGPWGLLQGIADGVKSFFKEDVTPRGCDKILFYLGPALTVIPAFMALTIIPFGDKLPESWFGHSFDLSIGQIDAGILVLLALTSVGVYGITLAGWSSNSKYSLLGSVRSGAQMISYEVAFGLALIGVLLLSGTLSLQEFAEQQAGPFWNWYVFQQPLGFLLFFIAAFAENNRLPFDMAEAETELGAGFHTEYSSMKFALFFLAEYVSMVAMGSVVVTLYFGGWQGPFGFYLFKDVFADIPALYILETIFWWVSKVFLYVLFMIYIRATLPRFRYDQLMDLGWKVMTPLGLANIIVTACAIAFLQNGFVRGVFLFCAGLGMILFTDLILTNRIRRVKRYGVPGVEVPTA